LVCFFFHVTLFYFAGEGPFLIGVFFVGAEIKGRKYLKKWGGGGGGGMY